MKQQPLIISNDNPFKDQIMSRLKENTSNAIVSEEYTLTIRKTYLPIGFVKLYQDNNILKGLSPDACKLLVVMALKLEFNMEQLRLTKGESGLERRRFSRAIMELLLAGVIAKVSGKKEQYWVNVALIVVGKIAKHE